MSHESDDDLPLAQVKARRNSVEDSDSGASSDSMSDAPSIQNVPLKNEMTLFEYEWPNNRSGNYFVIESELAKFLDREEIPGKKFHYFSMFSNYLCLLVRNWTYISCSIRFYT